MKMFEIMVETLGKQVWKRINAATFLNKAEEEINAMTEEAVVNNLRAQIFATIDCQFWSLDKDGHYREVTK